MEKQATAFQGHSCAEDGGGWDRGSGCGSFDSFTVPALIDCLLFIWQLGVHFWSSNSVTDKLGATIQGLKVAVNSLHWTNARLYGPWSWSQQTVNGKFVSYCQRWWRLEGMSVYMHGYPLLKSLIRAHCPANKVYLAASLFNPWN